MSKQVIALPTGCIHSEKDDSSSHSSMLLTFSLGVNENLEEKGKIVLITKSIST